MYWQLGVPSCRFANSHGARETFSSWLFGSNIVVFRKKMLGNSGRTQNAISATLGTLMSKRQGLF